MRTFYAMFKARSMEFVRDRGTFFWNLLFPIILVFGFSFAFSDQGTTNFKVGVLGSPEDEFPFMQIEQIDFVQYGPGAENESARQVDLDAAVERVRRHELDMVIDFTSREYYINGQSSTGPLLRRLFEAEVATASAPGVAAAGGGGTGAGAGAAAAGAGTTSAGGPGAAGTERPAYTEQEVTGEPIRYVDWLVPGVIGMNMMFSCLFGIGFVIVRYRKNGVLKRFKATPVSALNFVSAQAASRLIIVVLTSIVVFAGTNIFLGFMMNGSYLNLLLITTLAIISMISIGLLFASRLKSEELASGLLNLVTFPMLIFSGVFFSLEGTPQILQSFSRALPLTHFIEGARAIMLDGAGFAQVAPNMLFLAAISAVFLVLSSFMFRWE
jgi:ABC transporter DrrB family efflux protein